MPKLINLRPIQTGDACYLQDHHNREGECIITVTMCDGCASYGQALDAISEAMLAEERLPTDADHDSDMRCAVGAAQWCAEQWQLAQADLPRETDRDTVGQDEERYLECHILATWEV